uniref:Large ribosomal subunit protein mL37 n=1 Tax=Sinocyclocheilus anshuiensis TaxID=1608454 RepID=A0A671P9F6_9TELE
MYSLIQRTENQSQRVFSSFKNLRCREDVFQVRGQNGLLLNSMTPVPVVPIAPSIDLQNTHVYQEKNDTGQPLTSFTITHRNTPKLLPEQLRAKMIMFSFGNALVRAQALYGKPIVVQSVASNGRLFQFVVFQLNSTDLQSDSGVKNLAWVDEDQPLYEWCQVLSLLLVPAGLSGFQPNTKFLALYLHGAV